MGFTTTFKVGAMPYDMVERSMGALGEEVVLRTRGVLDCEPPLLATHRTTGSGPTPAIHTTRRDRLDWVEASFPICPAGEVHL
jgi:hypothetical protein